MPEYENVIYETLDEGTIARIWLNRPEFRNAQSFPLLDDLNDAFLTAESDDKVKVVILAGKGTSFSSGHDMGTPGTVLRARLASAPPRAPTSAGTASGNASSSTSSAGETCARRPWRRYTARASRPA